MGRAPRARGLKRPAEGTEKIGEESLAGVDEEASKPTVAAPPTPADDGPVVLRASLERGLNNVLSRRAWPRAEVAVNADTRVLSLLAGRSDLHEFPLEDCTLHHSRVTAGYLGVRFTKRDCQLLLNGRPEGTCRLFKEILAATRGIQRRATGPVEKYKFLDGVPSKLMRRRVLAATLEGGASAGAGEEKFRGTGALGGLSAEAADLLTAEQRAVCEAALRGESLFFTGGAGTGKSFLLRQLLQVLDGSCTAVTASTALAASQLGGITLHKWAAVGRGEGSVVDLAAELKGRREALARWRRTRTLVIDEISMVDGDLFEKLEILSRAIRGSDLPFGGLQLILAGDFLQLPPVQRTEGGGSLGFNEREAPTRFCFEVRAWQKAVKRTFELTEVFRQKGDADFCRVLNEIRFGELSEESVRMLAPRLVAGTGSAGNDVTRLMPLRFEVESVNSLALAALPGQLVCFEAIDEGDPAELDQLTGARRNVELRVGALVMLTRTVSARRRLVNGAQGKVVAFTGAGSLRLPVVNFQEAGVEVAIGRETFEAKCGARTLGVRAQLPLELAWAVSVHKSQGMTLSAVEVSMERIFEHGQVYVALSRARSLDGLYLVGSEENLRRHVHAEPRCVAFHRGLSAATAAAAAAQAANARAEAPRTPAGEVTPRTPQMHSNS